MGKVAVGQSLVQHKMLQSQNIKLRTPAELALAHLDNNRSKMFQQSGMQNRFLRSMKKNFFKQKNNICFKWMMKNFYQAKEPYMF